MGKNYLFILEPEERDDRAKDFLLVQVHVTGEVSEDGWLVEQFAHWVISATHDKLGTLALGIIHHVTHPLELALVDQRTLVDTLLHAISRLDLLVHSLTEMLYKLVVDPRLDKNSVGADTGLASIAELGDHHSLDGQVQISRVKDNERRISTKLQGDFLHRVCTLAVQDLA